MARYVSRMAHTSSPPKLVRDARTGRWVEVRGAGALKGKLTLKRGIDLTKPIFEQVSKDRGGAPGAAKG